MTNKNRNILFAVVTILIVLNLALGSVVYYRLSSSEKTDNDINAIITAGVQNSQAYNESMGGGLPKDLNALTNEIIDSELQKNSTTNNNTISSTPDSTNKPNNSSISKVLQDQQDEVLKDFIVNQKKDGLKIIIIGKEQTLPDNFKSLILRSNNIGINYVFTLQDNKLTYLGDSIQYQQEFDYLGQPALFSMEYVEGFGYPKFYININGNRYEVKTSTNVPVKIYPDPQNPQNVKIEAFESVRQLDPEEKPKVFTINLVSLVATY